MILVSGPAIAALRLRTRKWAHEAMGRGWFGPAMRHKGILYVDLRAVEAATGIRFTEQQIELAAQGKPGRILRVPDTNPQEAAYGCAEAQANR